MLSFRRMRSQPRTNLENATDKYICVGPRLVFHDVLAQVRQPLLDEVRKTQKPSWFRCGLAVFKDAGVGPQIRRHRVPVAFSVFRGSTLSQALLRARVCSCFESPQRTREGYQVSIVRAISSRISESFSNHRVAGEPIVVHCNVLTGSIWQAR